MKRISIRIAAGIALLLAVPYCRVQAADVEAKLMHTSTDKRAIQILDKAYHYLDSLKAFSFKATLTNEDLYDGKMVVELTHRIEVLLQRPGHLKIDIIGDARNRSYYLNETLLTIFDRDRMLYGELKVPRGIDGALDEAFEHYRIKTPLANLLYSDVERRLKMKTDGYYFGMAYVGETLCDYIGFVDQRRSIQFWVAKGEKPLIRRYVIIDKSTPMRLHSTVVIDWSDERLKGKNSFQFIPPESAKRIKILAPEGDSNE